MTDDLSWLDDLPEEWEPPRELRVPTRVPFVNFVIIVLSTDAAPNGVVVAVAELLAAKERFSIRCMTRGKDTLDGSRLLELSTISNDLLKQSWEAWVQYSATAGRGADRYLDVIAAWRSVKSRFDGLVPGEDELNS